ncbi:hypothetical protein BDZ94DRAFT_1222620 [Collybia nuda]|uniref:Uncharacterized protein n=1 Tax=Collybia nuda TaxID=64659 RepID=A0A9P5Y3P5_9AGAR|nr:hypothetical protein BDZ94DRAFT_1222620 [Collybia nuda]
MHAVVGRTSRLSQIFHPRGATTSGIPSTLVNLQNAPLFQRLPPWWARWTLALIACDIFMTGSAIELTWNRWSEKVSEDEASLTSSGEYTLRPVWQRLGLCTAHLGLGVGLAAALVVAQARFVRTLVVVPPSPGFNNRRVFVQCAHNLRRNGMTFPLNKCSLGEGRNETEMILRVTGEKGHWFIGLEDSIVNGQRAGLPENRAAVLSNWGGKRIGNWTGATSIDSRWKSGPARRA